MIASADVLSVAPSPVKHAPRRADPKVIFDGSPVALVVFTIVAATSQSLRNAAQHGLTGVLGTVGATQVRFLFGMPFGLIALAGVAVLAGPLPVPNLASLAWMAVGAMGQIGGTALMLAAMRERSFVVTTAYTKTEPIQVALFTVVFLGERITAALAAAILIATAGVLMLSWPSRAAGSEVFSGGRQRSASCRAPCSRSPR